MGRGLGWECVHVCIDDHSRVVFAEILPDERGVAAAGFLGREVTWYVRGLGVRVRRLLTEHSACYRSRAFPQRRKRLELGHRPSRPYLPRSSGKA